MTLLLALYVHTLELSAELSAGGPESVGPVGPDFADIEKRTEAVIEFTSYPLAQFAASANGCALAHTTAGSMELGNRGAPPLFVKNISKSLFL